MQTAEREASAHPGTYVPAKKLGTMATIRRTSCGIYAETVGEICIRDAVAAFVAGGDVGMMRDLYATIGAALDEATLSEASC